MKLVALDVKENSIILSMEVRDPVTALLATAFVPRFSFVLVTVNFAERRILKINDVIQVSVSSVSFAFLTVHSGTSTLCTILCTTKGTRYR